MLSLDSPVKVGRSVARARPIQTNAIFDCKVNTLKVLENWAVLKSLSIVVHFLVFRCFLAIMRCCGMRMASSTFRFVFLPFVHLFGPFVFSHSGHAITSDFDRHVKRGQKKLWCWAKYFWTRLTDFWRSSSFPAKPLAKVSCPLLESLPLVDVSRGQV